MAVVFFGFGVFLWVFFFFLSLCIFHPEFPPIAYPHSYF